MTKPAIELAENDEDTAAMFPGGDDEEAAAPTEEPTPVKPRRAPPVRKRGAISRANYQLLELVAKQRRRDPWMQLDVILENVLSQADSPAYEPKR